MVIQLQDTKKILLEQMDEIEGLKEFFSEREFERLKRISKGEAIGNDRLCISNNIIKIKFELRDRYKTLERLYEEKKGTKESLDFMLSEENKKTFFTLSNKKSFEKYLKYLDDGIDSIKQAISAYGVMLVHYYIPALDKYFTEKEIIQVLSGSYSQAKRIKDYYDKKETGTSSLADSFINHHVEYRWRKGRCKDFIDCPMWEMPLFKCVSSYIWEVIKENPKAKADMYNFMENMFEEAAIYTTTDEEGNIISAEKVYQTLTANELIRNYKGSFINELKQKNIIDNQAAYKIKRIDTGIYDVIGEDGEDISRIYSK
ncbi:hypothetical protein [uncultured Clostridium sp.]|uniref:hypothetical protein n=1 Tax=uncultured Clostridium sp. TaxID=59620 RepID=UPI00258F8CD0|nr:hypothetical protein [uncultured Clostridium sp.]